VTDTLSTSEPDPGAAPYSMRSRRLPAEPKASRPQAASRFALDDAAARPATPTKPPAPFGDLSQAAVDAIVELAAAHGGSAQNSQRKKRRRGTAKLLTHLQSFPGDTWQERWEASGLDDSDLGVSVLGKTKYEGYELIMAAQALFCLRVVKPSLVSFRGNKFGHYADYFVASQDDAALNAYYAAVEASPATAKARGYAKFDVACALTTQGVELADLSPDALLFYSLECRRLGLVPGSKGSTTGKFAAILAWDVLFNMGHFPADTPPALRKRISVGQLTPEQLVDRYDIKNAGVRQLLIDYLLRRQQDTDYITRANLAGVIAGSFWAKIEAIAPNQPDLDLPTEVYDQWKELIKLRKDGEERVSIQSILLPVRALYLDLQSWALEEPDRWGMWAASCPIPTSDLRGFAKRRRAIKARMDDRTRVRQPLLPKLAAHVEDHWGATAALLAAALPLALGVAFEHGGRQYRRMDTRTDVSNHAAGHLTVRVMDIATGIVTDLVAAEEAAFWEWAYVEVLRHSGIRVEELVELSHASLRQYERPNGEVIALLVIAPSKTDRERVIPMSPDLFSVIATIIRRTTSMGPIPLIPRYDGAEREWTLPLPYLFQRQVGSVRRVSGAGTVCNALKRACERLAESDGTFADLHFTPHDFRRIFATEIVNSGLPIHIGAALLGHLNLQTTQGYVAVFNEDVVRHYQQFLAHRRTLRPVEEYRPASKEEWSEFEEHFDKRKVELGSCGRPYGSPCEHEHSCIRCPMLHVNPKMIYRLDEIEEDLEVRRERAIAEGWRGEIEGIDLTLRFLRDKREESQRLSTTTREVSLGMPTIGVPAQR
jgi:site-specific recombinase XerC